MRTSKGPRTPLGKARKRIKELEAELEAANRKVACYRKHAADINATIIKRDEAAHRWAVSNVIPENFDPGLMLEAYAAILKPKKTTTHVALEAMRAAYRMQVMAEEALARHRRGGR